MDAKIRRLKFKEPRAEHFEEVETPLHYREQAPEIINRIDRNRPAAILERHRDRVKTYMPHWLAV